MIFPEDPLAAIADGLARARRVEVFDPTAMSLATADASGRPSVRMVLLKAVDARGITFFTNYGSRKAAQIAENAFAAGCIHWPKLAEQVRVEGGVERCSEEESDAYFATRARGSQIGAWASRQSAPIDSRDALLARVREIETRFAGVPIPRPPFWGGYRIVAERIELWWGHDDRLHERAAYTRQGATWTVERLQP